MILLGVCAPPERAGQAAAAGFDFMEYGLAGIAAMSEGEFREARAAAGGAGIRALAANGMFPGDMRLTGEGASLRKALDYLGRALDRAARLGIETAVFGSGGARSAPKGYPMGDAWRQIAEFLSEAGGVARERGVTIAIEPLRRAESNIINLVTEATALAAIANDPNVAVLADTHHMICSGEPLGSLALAGGLLRHAHVSRSYGDEGGRVYPAPSDGGDYAGLFAELIEMGYKGGVSVEAGCEEFAADGAAAVMALKKGMAAGAALAGGRLAAKG